MGGDHKDRLFDFIARRKDISPTAKILYAYVCTWCYRKGGYRPFFFSTKKIAARLNLSETNVRRAKWELWEADFFTVYSDGVRADGSFRRWPRHTLTPCYGIGPLEFAQRAGYSSEFPIHIPFMDDRRASRVMVKCGVPLHLLNIADESMVFPREAKGIDKLDFYKQFFGLTFSNNVPGEPIDRLVAGVLVRAKGKRVSTLKIAKWLGIHRKTAAASMKRLASLSTVTNSAPSMEPAHA